MRQLATLPSAEARTLADYLLTLKIDTRLDQQPEGWVVWVCDEDRMPQAQQELAEFTRNPQDTRYTAAARTADALRRGKVREEKAYTRRQERFHQRMAAGGSRAWTFTLIAISIGVAAFSDLGYRPNAEVIRQLSIAPYRVTPEGFDPGGGLRSVLHGEVWRLVTPIFIHFGLWHLLVNMYMLYHLGGAVEIRRGPIRFLLLVVVLAVLSNLAQYFLGHPVWDGSHLEWMWSPTFGGMSGVIYGLFGYIWMKSRYQPELGLSIDRTTVLFLFFWFFLCLTGWIGSVANMAHAAGLVAGILIGYLLRQ